MLKQDSKLISDYSVENTISINLNKNIGITAPVYIQEIARRLPEYNEIIDSVEAGVDKFGNKILVNTAGRWLFGVPGSFSHARIVAVENKVLLYFSNEAPTAVLNLIISLKDEIEKNE